MQAAGGGLLQIRAHCMYSFHVRDGGNFVMVLTQFDREQRRVYRIAAFCCSAWWAHLRGDEGLHAREVVEE